MSIGLILVILLVIFLFGGFSGRFGGYGYGYGHGGIGVLGIILIVAGKWRLVLCPDLSRLACGRALAWFPASHFIALHHGPRGNWEVFCALSS